MPLVTVVVATVEVRSSVVGVFGGRRLGQLYFGGRVIFEAHPAPQTGKDGRYFGGVLGRLGSQVLVAAILELGAVGSEAIS